MNKMTKKSWFEVSRKGLRELQAGKPKDFILKELIQNAWDEDGITYCRIRAYKNPGIATISIEDDAPEGFKDLSHAFTLFSPTYKRSDPKKRGRFNIGEKQVLAICRAASISTTKGTIVFDSKGRHHRRLKRNEGSVISIIVPMNQKDFDEAIAKIRNYLPPKGIEMTMNGEPIEYREPKLIISEPLDTDVHGPELSKEEWRQIKAAEIIPSSAILFPTTIDENTEHCPRSAWTERMESFAELTKKIAARCLGIQIIVNYAAWKGCTAVYHRSRPPYRPNGEVIYNTNNLNIEKLGLYPEFLSLIIHELAHEKGSHTEMAYHEAMSEMAAKLILVALDEPEFFNF